MPVMSIVRYRSGVALSLLLGQTLMTKLPKECRTFHRLFVVKKRWRNLSRTRWNGWRRHRSGPHHTKVTMTTGRKMKLAGGFVQEMRRRSMAPKLLFPLDCSLPSGSSSPLASIWSMSMKQFAVITNFLANYSDHAWQLMLCTALGSSYSADGAKRKGRLPVPRKFWTRVNWISDSPVTYWLALAIRGGMEEERRGYGLSSSYRSLADKLAGWLAGWLARWSARPSSWFSESSKGNVVELH